MRKKLSKQMEENGPPEPLKPIEIAPGRFDPTPTAYPKNWVKGLGFSFAQGARIDDWGSPIDVPIAD